MTRALAICLLSALGCATGDSIRDRTINDEPPAYQVAPTAQPMKRDPRAPPDDPKLCEAWARSFFPDGGDAWVALHTCFMKKGFRALRPLVKPPWLDLLKGMLDGPPFMAALVARRGGDVRVDLVELARVGFPLRSLEQAQADEARSNGKWVLVSCLLPEGRTPEKGTLEVEDAELVAGANSRWSRGQNDVQSRSTGVPILLRLAGPAPAVKPWERLVALGRYKRRKPVDERRPDEKLQLVELVDAQLWRAKPGAALFDD